MESLSVAPSILTIFKWVMDTFGKEIVSKSVEEVWDCVEWQVAAKEYSGKLRRLHSITRVLGKNEPVSLQGVYTDVHILPRPRAFHRFTVEQLEEQYSNRETRDQDVERREGLAVVREKNKLFILGKPGAGKTTFCKYITLQAIEGQIDKVPIFVSLKEMGDSEKSVLGFIVSQFDICNFPDAQPFVEQLLKTGKAVVLFDGLDEVQQINDKQMNVIAGIKEFVTKYDKSQYLITCRIAATDYTFEPFTYIEMADFTDVQVRAFARKWFAQDDERGGLFLAEYEKPEHANLRELAQTPLLLALLCLAFEETLTFPQRRVELYEEALDALLKKWDASRNIKRDEIYRRLTLARKRQMLARIAVTTFDQRHYFIPQQVLARQIEEYLHGIPPTNKVEQDEEIDGVAILKAVEVQHGIFIERARQIYSFSHLTFQEYFTARYIWENAGHGTLKQLVHHLTDDRWHEVFLLTASLLNNANGFFELLIDRVNELTYPNKSLSALLTWIDERAKAIGSDDMVTRSIYLYFILLLINVYTFRTTPREVVQARASGIARTLDSGLDRDFIYAHSLTRYERLDRIRDPVLDLARARNFVANLGRVLEHSLARTVASDLARVLNTNYMVLAVALSEPDLSEYLYATQLVLSCLQLAYVTNRTGIESRLLLPPQQSPS